VEYHVRGHAQKACRTELAGPPEAGFIEDTHARHLGVMNLREGHRLSDSGNGVFGPTEANENALQHAGDS
jgi:hypothetical protein